MITQHTYSHSDTNKQIIAEQMERTASEAAVDLAPFGYERNATRIARQRDHNKHKHIERGPTTNTVAHAVRFITIIAENIAVGSRGIFHQNLMGAVRSLGCLRRGFYYALGKFLGELESMAYMDTEWHSSKLAQIFD